MVAAASYRTRFTPAKLERRGRQLRKVLEDCTVCAHECHVNRTRGEYGVCRTYDDIVVSSSGPHYGEEPPLVGSRGSGTIFLTSCNLKCQYCQNSDISQMRRGRRISTSELAHMMLSLQEIGCHNINFVTPSHVVPQIVEAVAEAASRGLTIPLVYNCGGYESLATIRQLDGIIDIYMPDIKYSDNSNARKYSGSPEYWDVVRPVIKEMHRQVGDLTIDERGLARRGLLIRHLVLPQRIAGTQKVLDFVSSEISPDSYINIMDQYRPMYRAYRHPSLNRPVTVSEYSEALAYASSVGLHRGFEDRHLTINSQSAL